MLKKDLEDVVLETNRKLDEGITIFVKDHRSSDAIIKGLISGAAFMISSLIVQEIRSAHIRRKNRKWFMTNKES